MKQRITKKTQPKRTKSIAAEANVSPAPTEAILDRPSKKAKNDPLAVALCIATCLIFILLWFKVYKPDVKDNWFQALDLINLSTQTLNESEKSRLLSRAESLLRDVRLQHPYHARPWMIYGYYFIQKKMWDSAITCERKAIELGKGGTVNQVEFEAADGLCYALSMKLDSTQLKKVDATAVLLKNAAVKGFENRCLYKLQGLFYTNLNKPDSALIYLEKAALMQPDADVYYNIAVNHWRKGDRIRSIQNLNKALEVNKDHELARRMLKEISK